MRRGLCVAVLLAALSPACGKSERLAFEPAFQFDPSAKRNFVPFPIDLMTRADSSSRTGVRLNITAGMNRDMDRMLAGRDTLIGYEAISPVVHKLSFEGIRNQMNALDGFGLLSPIIAPVSAPVDLAGLPALEASTTPESPIWIVDTTNWVQGSSIDLTTQRIAFSSRWEPSGYQVILDPLLPLKGGHKYTVVLRRTLQDRSGRGLSMPSDYRKLIDGNLTASGDAATYTARMKSFHNEILSRSVSDAVLAFEFTTMSGADDVVNAVKNLGAAPLPSIDNVEAIALADLPSIIFGPSSGTHPDHLAEVSTLVRGTFRSLDFRGSDELMPDRIETGDALPSATQEIQFLLALPKSARPASGYPIVIMQHGLDSQKFKEDKWLRFVNRLATEGVAVIGIDAIRHAFRAREDLKDTPGIINWALDLIDFSNPLRTRDSIRQNFLDLWQLSNKALPALNAVSLPTCGASCFDLTRKGYAGESLGGILGAGFTSIDTSLRASVLYVGGGELTQLVRGDAENRYLFLLGVAENCVKILLPGGKPDNTCGVKNPLAFEFSDSPAAENLFFTAAQMLIDKSDPAVMAAGKYRQPFFEANLSNSLLMVESVEEKTVTNVSTEVLAVSFGVPHLGTVAHDVPGLPKIDQRNCPTSGAGAASGAVPLDGTPPSVASHRGQPGGRGTAPSMAGIQPVAGRLSPPGAVCGFVQIPVPDSEKKDAHVYPLTSAEGSKMGADFLVSALMAGSAKITPP
ncbi:MAG: hypothetical protein HYT87_03440 [Nitrospirae bacterium]|nr:hypothetical protein [Nitrospirota bacterium]